jgi:hypothetical protein
MQACSRLLGGNVTRYAMGGPGERTALSAMTQLVLSFLHSLRDHVALQQLVSLLR